MPARTYVETSVISYLVAPLSNDLIVAAHQRTTREWWSIRDHFDLFVSELVIGEASAGDEHMAALRLEALAEASILEVTEPVRDLARLLVDGGPLPPTAAEDAFHIAVSVVNGMDYLVTWNCRHIANASMRPHIERICRGAGFEPSIICTPEELLHA
ncbi:MAG: type II toxin-antitoxin system VapC family toxin [Planctomycetota bacterium]|jgi:hypothetical protein